MSGMTTCSPLSSWYPDIKTRNSLVLYCLLSLPMKTSGTLMLKEYYAVATGATPPKPKASVQKNRSSFDTTITPPTAAAGPRLTTSENRKQAAKASKAKSLSTLFEVAMIEAQQLKLATKRSLQQTHIYQASGSGVDEGTGNDDDDNQDVEEDDEKDDEEDGGDDEQDFDEEEFIHPSLSTHAKEEPKDEESFDPISRTTKTVMMKAMSSSVSSKFVTSMLNPTPDAGMELIFETTSQMDAQTPTLVAPLPMSAPTITPSTIATITTTQQAPLPPTTASITLLQVLPNFGLLFRFDHRLKTLEANFSEFSQINHFAVAFDRLRDEAQVDNDEFLKTIDENMQKIIKEQLKEQLKVQVSKILPKIEQTVNEQLEAEVLTRNIYKAIVDAYESNKIILDTYGDTVTLKRRRDDDADKDEKPSVGPDRGSKRRREGKEPEAASAPTETATRSAGKSTQVSKSR
uniref:Uncharacterized protein n=1 Tax=Tanacetum cinerariifolium TaxID=118510 RepID=A0A699KTD1_TANCI|nr:hypothetical protein [Tanacetum cinerariifolium]